MLGRSAWASETVFKSFKRSLECPLSPAVQFLLPVHAAPSLAPVSFRSSQLCSSPPCCHAASHSLAAVGNKRLGRMREPPSPGGAAKALSSLQRHCHRRRYPSCRGNGFAGFIYIRSFLTAPSTQTTFQPLTRNNQGAFPQEETSHR